MYPQLQYYTDFQCPKKLLALLFIHCCPSSSTHPLATTDLFTDSIVLPFPDGRIVRIILYEAFQIGYFHLEVYI